tara:strand:- start:2007 stop:2648 length:642 start_codon:yes stop_codon:yes gene_type:complete
MHHEFLKIETDYQNMLNSGVQQYLMSVMSDLLQTHENHEVMITPVIGYDFTVGSPILLTVAAVGCAKIGDVNVPLSIALWPLGEISGGMLGWADQMEIDPEDIVGTLLERKLALIALEQDLADAKQIGWTKVLLEVSAHKRKTNFESATSVHEAQINLSELANVLPQEYKDLFNAIMEQYGRAEFDFPLGDPVPVEMDDCEAEYSRNWQDEWA